MPEESKPDQPSGHTRRSILGKFSLGLVGIAGAGLLFRNFLFSGRNEQPDSAQVFPGEESIFHPRRDPRLEAVERRRNT